MFYVFVVNRPYQLPELLETADRPFGVMCNPFDLTDNFVALFRDFPSTERWGDNGIFSGHELPVRELFQIYERLGVTHGVAPDVFGEAEATLERAKDAMTIWKAGQYSFELVSVAQGREADEYITSIEELKAMGYRSIAVGGLLRSIGRSKHHIRHIDTVLIGRIRRRLNGNLPERLHWLGALRYNRDLIHSADSIGWCRDWINMRYSRLLSPTEARKRYLKETYFTKRQERLPGL
jgi:hypothetical protein